jgi:type III secretion protein J
LTEAEVQQAIVVLQQYGIDAKKEKIGEGKEATFTLLVPADQIAQANQILGKYELPRTRPKGFEDVFSESGLIPTATEEKAKYLLALQGEISRTLETVDGVISARVHIVIPEKDPLEEQTQAQASAGVFIKYRGEHQPLTSEEIKQIVSHSVDELEQGNVAVVMKKIHLDESDIPQLGQTQGGFLTSDRAKIIVPVLAGICIVLAAILVFLMRSLQNEKRKRLQMQREMSMMAAAPRK